MSKFIQVSYYLNIDRCINLPPCIIVFPYFSCVRPIIEYASTCWTPSSEKLNHDIEMIQHNAAKFVCNKYPKKGHYEEFSITALLSDLKWTSPEERRERAKLNVVFKILNNDVILPPDVLPKVTPSRTRTCNVPYVGEKNQLFEPSHVVLNNYNSSVMSIPFSATTRDLLVLSEGSHIFV